MVDPVDGPEAHAPTLAAPRSGSADDTALPRRPSHGDARDLQRVAALVMHGLFGDPVLPLQHGRYRLRRELGRGGMGTVWAADDPQLGRTVAIKVLALRGPGTTRNSRDETRALLREAQAVARLADPHVVEVYDVGSSGEQAFIVMELVEGGTLASWLAARERNVAEIVDAVVQAGRGLAAAHRAGVLHRDFKPANVLRTAAGVFKVADFGLAIAPRSIDVPSSAAGLDAPHEDATEPGIAGTPAFMAPEQHAGLPLDARADQYALCVTAWSALSGQLPFTGSMASLVLGKQDGPPAPPKRDGVPPALWRVLSRGLAPLPGARWPGVDALCDALLAVVHPRRRWLVPTALLGAGAVASALLLSPGPQPPRCTAFDRLATQWSDTRDGLEQRLAGSPLLSDTRGAVLADLDRRVLQWDDARAAVCETTAEALQLGDARIACLAAARRQLEATTLGLRELDEAGAANVRDRIAALADPDACLQGESQAPLAPAVAALRERLGELDAREQVARDEAALAEAEALLVEARALGDTVAIVHCDLVLARTASALAHHEFADTRGQEALWTALTVGDDVQGFEAALVLTTNAVHALAYDDAARHARTAQSLLDHLGDDPTRAARLERALGMIDSRSGRIEDGVEHYRRSLALAEGHADPPLLAGLELDVGAVEQQLGELSSARARFERAHAMLVAWYGPRHLDVADVELMIAIATASAEGPRTALVPLEHAVGIYRAVLPEGDPRLANALGVLGYLQAACGEHEHALVAWQAVQRSHASNLGPEHARTLAAAANVAAVLVELDRIDEAEALALDAGEGLRAAGEYGVDHLALALDVRARVEARRGHAARAIELWTEALAAVRAYGDPELATEPATHLAALWVAQGEPRRARELLATTLAEAAPKPSLRRATAQLVLADSMWSTPSDRAAARSLVTEARATVQTRQGPAATLARMDAWLQTHPG